MDGIARSTHHFKTAMFFTLLLVLGAQSWARRTLVDIIVAQNVKSELQPKLDRLAADPRNDGYTARVSTWPAL